MTVTTPSPRRRLDGVTVAASIGNSPDLSARGLGEMHVRSAFIDVARQILAAGGVIAYGGNLTESGYTQALFDLVRTYRGQGDSRPRVISFLAWPSMRDLDPSREESLKSFVRFERIYPNVAGIDLEANPDLWDESLQRVVRTWALTAMRDATAKEIQKTSGARVVLGGKRAGFSGMYPGIVEESWMSIRDQTPLFVCGGFGGAAAVVVSTLRGEQGTEEAFEHPKLKPTPVPPPERTLDEMLEDIRKAGLNGLRNGLSESENEELMSARNGSAIARLVLKGLANLRRS